MENEIQNTFRIFYLKIFPSEFCPLMYTYMYETEKKIYKVLFLHATIKSDFLKYIRCFHILQRACVSWYQGQEGQD